MTPQEKAKELTDKFFPNYSFDSWDIRTGYAKKHALICVEEIMKVIPQQEVTEICYSSPIARKFRPTSIFEYWLEVKTEIEKL